MTEDPSHHQGHAQGKRSGSRVIQDICRGSVMTKKPTQQGNPGQKTMQQKKGSAPKKDAQTGKKDNAPMHRKNKEGGTQRHRKPHQQLLHKR
jgi:hypothetical protein